MRAACLLIFAVLMLPPNALAQVVPRVQPTGKAQEKDPAQEQEGEKEGKKDKESPWLLIPTFSSNPKLGLSLGALGAYLHYFDKQSQVSMFGISGQYTSTESTVAAAFAKTSFDADHQRLLALVVGGVIKNDYDDFLGTGQPLKKHG